jgi:hypothetical protein
MPLRPRQGLQVGGALKELLLKKVNPAREMAKQTREAVCLSYGRFFILFRSKYSGSASARVTLLHAEFW